MAFTVLRESFGPPEVVTQVATFGEARALVLAECGAAHDMAGCPGRVVCVRDEPNVGDEYLLELCNFGTPGWHADAKHASGEQHAVYCEPWPVPPGDPPVIGVAGRTLYRVFAGSAAEWGEHYEARLRCWFEDDGPPEPPSPEEPDDPFPVSLLWVDFAAPSALEIVDELASVREAWERARAATWSAHLDRIGADPDPRDWEQRDAWRPETGPVRFALFAPPPGFSRGEFAWVLAAGRSGYLAYAGPGDELEDLPGGEDSPPWVHALGLVRAFAGRA